MKANTKDKIKFVARIIVLALVILTFLVFGVTLWAKGKIIEAIVPGIIAIVILIFLIPLLIRNYKDINKGFPFEDERSKKVMMRAGYYAFLISIWYLLILSWLSDDLIQFRDVSQALGIGILGMAIIFGLCWLWVNKRGFKE